MFLVQFKQERAQSFKEYLLGEKKLKYYRTIKQIQLLYNN